MNQLGSGVLWIEEQLDPVQGKGSTTEGDLRAVLHIPETLTGTGDSLRGGTGKGAALNGLEQCVKFRHPPESRMHVSQLPDSAVRDGFALQVGGRPCRVPMPAATPPTFSNNGPCGSTRVQDWSAAQHSKGTLGSVSRKPVRLEKSSGPERFE